MDLALIVGCYSLNLYCQYSRCSVEENGLELRHDYDNPGEDEFTGYDRAQTYAAARKAGWVFSKNGDVICKTCAQQNRGKK